MCLMEVMRLRVKDVDFTRGEILVRDGKGQKDCGYARQASRRCLGAR